MKARNYLGSYLKQEDVPEPAVVTISGAGEESLEENERPKLILYFKELEKGLVCNKTNINMLISMCGDDDTDRWINSQVLLYVDKSITFGSKRVGGIRVGPVSGTIPAAPQTKETPLSLEEETGPLLAASKEMQEEDKRERAAIQAEAANGLQKKYLQCVDLCFAEGVDITRKGFLRGDEKKLDRDALENRIFVMQGLLGPASA